VRSTSARPLVAENSTFLLPGQGHWTRRFSPLSMLCTHAPTWPIPSSAAAGGGAPIAGVYRRRDRFAYKLGRPCARHRKAIPTIYRSPLWRRAACASSERGKRRVSTSGVGGVLVYLGVFFFYGLLPCFFVAASAVFCLFLGGVFFWVGWGGVFGGGRVFFGFFFYFFFFLGWGAGGEAFLELIEIRSRAHCRHDRRGRTRSLGRRRGGLR